MKQVLIVMVYVLFAKEAVGQAKNLSWNASIGGSYLSRYTAYGIDLTESSAASLRAGVSHTSGVSLSAGVLQTLGSEGDVQHWRVGLGFNKNLTDVFSIGAEFEHYEYANDSANVLAPLANSLSIGADLDLSVLSLGVSYDIFLGSNSASYISTDVSSFFDVGPLYIVPLVQATFVSQEIEDRFLKSNGKGKNPASTVTTSTTTVTGLSSISLHIVMLLPLLDGLTLTLHPYYLSSPKSELSTSSSQFVWSVGLRYSGPL